MFGKEFRHDMPNTTFCHGRTKKLGGVIVGGGDDAAGGVVMTVRRRRRASHDEP